MTTLKVLFFLLFKESLGHILCNICNFLGVYSKEQRCGVAPWRCRLQYAAIKVLLCIQEDNYYSSIVLIHR